MLAAVFYLVILLLYSPLLTLIGLANVAVYLVIIFLSNTAHDLQELKKTGMAELLMIEENQSDPRRADADGLPDTERPGVCRKSDGQRLPRQAGAAEELQRAFAAHGVELAVDEVREICVAIMAKKDGTLDEGRWSRSPAAAS